MPRRSRQEPSKFMRWFATALLVIGVIVAPVTAANMAQADVPQQPIAAPFDAPLCSNTSGNPAVDADGGPVPNLLSVFGQRLTDYNAGKAVVLYNNSGRSGWTASNSQYSANPLCMTRYVDGVGAVSSWAYCTYDRASTCGWTNALGQLERNGTVLPSLEYQEPDTRLTADQQKLQAYIIQNDIPVVAGPNGSGGTVATDTIANDSSAFARTLRQNLVHCIDNPARSSGLVFCANNMSPQLQARILERIGGANDTLLTATSPTATVVPGATGQITVSTTLAGVPITVSASGATVSVCDGPATLSGTTLVVASDATLPAQITLCVTRSDEGDASVSLSATPPVIDNLGFVQSKRFDGDTLCQIFSVVEQERQATVRAAGTVQFRNVQVAVPAIGTSLVDSADGDRVLAWGGGTLIDTVSYQNLIPGVEYTVTGELMNKADGSGTGITGSVTFTPTEANGSVDVTFVVPTGFAGEVLVAFERVFEGGSATGEPVAVHEDINDAAQTVTVEEAPLVPAIGTSLVDSADGDRVLAWGGGTLIDTVSYQNLIPGVEYTVTGELMNKADGSGTGITGSATFTPTEANGSVDVTFVVPSGFAGEVLVAFERVFEGGSATGEPVAVHEDINDAAQTVMVEDAPVTSEPAIGTSLVDSVDNDHVLAAHGGTVIDTIAYQNLTPGVVYTVTGELMNKATGAGTGIVGSTTFTPTTPNGSTTVTFVVPDGYAGDVLVAYERVFEGAEATGEPVAVHEDINDAAQTVTVERSAVVTPVGEKPTGAKGGQLPTTGADVPWLGVGVAATFFVTGAVMLLAMRRRAHR